MITRTTLSSRHPHRSPMAVDPVRCTPFERAVVPSRSGSGRPVCRGYALPRLAFVPRDQPVYRPRATAAPRAPTRRRRLFTRGRWRRWRRSSASAAARRGKSPNCRRVPAVAAASAHTRDELAAPLAGHPWRPTRRLKVACGRRRAGLDGAVPAACCTGTAFTPSHYGTPAHDRPVPLVPVVKGGRGPAAPRPLAGSRVGCRAPRRSSALGALLGRAGAPAAP